MSLAEFLPGLLEHGEARFSERPIITEKDRAESRTFLQEAFARYRLEVAGPRIELDAGVGLDAVSRTEEL